MNLTIRPIAGWSGERTPGISRKAHNFTRQAEGGWGRQDIPWSDTLVVLDRELNALQASSVVLQIDVTERDIRLDGLLRADARPADPAVRLLFDSKHGPLTYQCDRFTSWKDNARAIALGLEALRKVERYGITEHGEQYKGWLQLESGSGQAPTTDQACAIFTRYSGNEVTPGESDQSLRARWREARARTHPDRNGGSRTAWDEVESAAKRLGLS